MYLRVRVFYEYPEEPTGTAGFWYSAVSMLAEVLLASTSIEKSQERQNRSSLQVSASKTYGDDWWGGATDF